jgi:uncharacterized membrane protein (UPF0127 family)
MRKFAAVTALALSLLLAACSSSSRATPTVTPNATPEAAPDVTPVAFASTQLRIEASQGARDIEVEAAITGPQSERGLGYRDALAADAGMIFDLHSTRRAEFWMKGMRFALDMVWIGEDKRVASVTANIPPQPGVPDAQLRRYSPDAAVRYVLELNAGTAARFGIAPGTQLAFTLP